MHALYGILVWLANSLKILNVYRNVAIFPQLSYSEALDKSGLNRLDTRREEITKQIFRQIKSPTHPLHYLSHPQKFPVLRWY